MLRFLLFLAPFIVITCTTAAQNAAIYTIDKTNGLATNHVYTAMADKFGYLWLGTDKGVYRYNGYSLHKYDYTDGLSNIDVWRIYPDSKDRLWLLNVSDQLGYIKNYKYKRACIAAPDSTVPEIYPATILEYKNQLIITNKSNSGTNMTSVFIVKMTQPIIKTSAEMAIPQEVEDGILLIQSLLILDIRNNILVKSALGSIHQLVKKAKQNMSYPIT